MTDYSNHGLVGSFYKALHNLQGKLPKRWFWQLKLQLRLDTSHPISSIYGDTGRLDQAVEALPMIDVWGLNAYRGISPLSSAGLQLRNLL